MGYWNSEKFLSQVRHALTIAEIKYPALTHDLVFMFDQSSAYSLNANCMNMNPGGVNRE